VAEGIFMVQYADRLASWSLSPLALCNKNDVRREMATRNAASPVRTVAPPPPTAFPF
jgi:hypothetical protein